MIKKIRNKKTIPFLDECKYLILRIIDQAVRDYISLNSSALPLEQYDYSTACQFLFDNNYHINYGGADRNLKHLLEILDIDIIWFREKIIKMKNKKIQSYAIIREESIYEFFTEFMDEDNQEEEGKEKI